jgi:HEAT repeat protein
VANKQPISQDWTALLVASTLTALAVVGVPVLRHRAAPEVAPAVQVDRPAELPGESPAAVAQTPARAPLNEGALKRARKLLSPSTRDKPLENNEFTSRFTRLGAPGLRIAIALACGDVAAPEVVEGTLDEPIHPDALARRTQMLRAAIAGFDPVQRVAAIEERAKDATLDARRVLIQLLGDVDHRTALNELLRVTGEIEPIHFGRDYINAPIEEAFAALLTRRPEQVRELRLRWRDLPEGLAPALIRAAARVRTRTTLGFVIDLLGEDALLDLEILRTLARAGGSRMAIDEHALERLRRTASSDDDELKRATFDALGAFADGEAIDAIIDGLGSNDALAVRAAHGALKAIAGADRGPDSAAWTVWRDEELAWREGRSELLALQLEADDVGTVVAAIRELASHTLFRSECSAAIADQVNAADEDVSRAACEALVALGSSCALAPLVAELTDENEQRCARARAALVKLTGLELEADARLWSDALGL